LILPFDFTSQFFYWMPGRQCAGRKIIVPPYVPITLFFVQAKAKGGISRMSLFWAK
jgi:hypothetical protein